MREPLPKVSNISVKYATHPFQGEDYIEGHPSETMQSQTPVDKPPNTKITDNDDTIKDTEHGTIDIGDDIDDNCGTWCKHNYCGFTDHPCGID